MMVASGAELGWFGVAALPVAAPGQAGVMNEASKLI